jgi:hypothetical protein
MSPTNHEWQVKVLDDLNLVDLRKVADFFNEQFPGVFFPRCTPEVFEWKLGKQNPAGTGFITVALHDEKVIGVFTVTRKDAIKNGVEIAVGEIGDAYTHPLFRRGGKCISPMEHLALDDLYFEKSIFGRLVAETLFRAERDGVKFVYGTPNEMARPSYLKRLGFSESSGGRIYSKYFLTKNFSTNKRLFKLLKFLTACNFIYSRTLLRIYFGRNPITKISANDILIPKGNNSPIDLKNDKFLKLKVDEVFIKHRYGEHPTMEYSFYKIKCKNKDVGFIVGAEVIRPSGIKTFIVSDWISWNPKFEDNFEIILGSLRSFIGEAETISLWGKSKTAKHELLASGMFSNKKVSIVGKSLNKKFPQNEMEFLDFRFGWSDNG